ncbi:hypothetical protein [Nocardia sp. NPDC050793]|uniref:hypothetical protein n=1 Tax=Nocardia sp. NPDC050793 TaxID=3155159 RepID=UPI00340C5756
MTIEYNGDPERLRGSANNTAACLGELESHLKALFMVQDDLHDAVQSKGTGVAIYNSLGDAHSKGKILAGTLQEIIDELNNTGVQVELQDLEGAGRVNAALGNDHAVDAGSWSESSAAKINTSW